MNILTKSKDVSSTFHQTAHVVQWERRIPNRENRDGEEVAQLLLESFLVGVAAGLAANYIYDRLLRSDRM